MAQPHRPALLAHVDVAGLPTRAQRRAARARLRRARLLSVTGALVVLVSAVSLLRSGAGPLRPAEARAAEPPPALTAAALTEPRPISAFLLHPPVATRPTGPVAHSPAPAPARPTFGIVRRPVELAIPAIGLDTRIIRLGHDRQGVQVPASAHVAGWDPARSRPGREGTALLLGHVDSTTGPGVFYRLHQLRRGDHVVVTGADGVSAMFVVDRLASYSKTGFPMRSVFRVSGRPTLRLITCAGSFDRSTKHYTRNLVVFATLATT